MQQDHETDRLKQLISTKKMIIKTIDRFEGEQRVALSKKLARVERLIDSCKQNLTQHSEQYLQNTIEAVNERQRISDEYDAIKLKHEKRKKALRKAKAKAEKLRRQQKYSWVFEALAFCIIYGFFIGGGIFILYNIAMFFSGKPMWIPFYE